LNRLTAFLDVPHNQHLSHQTTSDAMLAVNEPVDWLAGKTLEVVVVEDSFGGP